ncbi:hypothetical protein ASE16_03580 [Leifsonia sp. Root227]|uniref:hypothetical protein n=1 Tax=Leifsonia sp. Root227 TaxID=1736496 RepID=UPI0006F21B6E|nr:hypothetical protein [Leifsonia sp. Root227]KRC52142.1 hypothetical protein ASE16_03580 [Leifsonia sp. Root227]
MNIQETAAVLAKIKIGDNREIDSKGIVLREWHQEIGHLDYQDALEAVVMHRRESTEYLQAGHIVANVARIRRQRERDERVANPRQIEPPKITLDRAEFDRLTRVALEQARAERRYTNEITGRAAL